MKRLLMLLSAFLIGVNAFAQSEIQPSVTQQTPQAAPGALGMPGDNLNLYLVLNLFKQSASIEEFEHQLNSPDSKVNNLDLNNDGSVDYLRVSDYGKNDYHTIVIQDIISASETQDVAIIDLQKKNGNIAHVQIVGDESLYGKNYIIEPQLDNTTSTSTTSQPATVVNNNYYTSNNYYETTPASYVNVWGWPCVNYIFSPVYRPWVSPWHWAYYPAWWYGRPRVIYSVYYGYFYDFGWHNYCRREHFINKVHYHNYYNTHRLVSNTVQVNITKNVYKNNYGNTDNVIGKGSYPKNNYAPDNTYNHPKQGMAPNNTDVPKGTWNGKPKYGNGNNNNWGGMNNQPKPEQSAEGKPKWNGYNNGGNAPKGNWNNNSGNEPKQNKWNNGETGGGYPGKWNNGGGPKGGGYNPGGHPGNGGGGHIRTGQKGK